jgi:hypothetical protein
MKMRTKAYSQKLRKPVIASWSLSVRATTTPVAQGTLISSAHGMWYATELSFWRTPTRTHHIVLHCSTQPCLCACVCVSVFISVHECALCVSVRLFVSVRVIACVRARARVCVFVSLSVSGIFLHRQRIHLHDSPRATLWYHCSISCHGSTLLTQLLLRESHVDMLTETYKYSLREPQAVWDAWILRYILMHLYTSWDAWVKLRYPAKFETTRYILRYLRKV